MKRGTPLKQRSPKTSKVYREQRIPLVKRLMEERPHCEAKVKIDTVEAFACWGPRDPHEIKTRGRGGSILDPSNILIVCRKHHDWIDDNQPDSHSLGLLKHSWEN